MLPADHGSDFTDLGDLKPVELKYRIGGVRYVLRECPEGDHCAWRSFQIKMARFNDDGKVAGMGNVADSRPLLVSFCLFRADQATGEIVLTDGNPQVPDLNHRVSLALIRSWPARIVDPLFEKAKEISGIDERETPEALWKRLRDAVAKLVKGNDAEPAGPAKVDPKTFDAILLRDVAELARQTRESLPKNSPSATTDTSD